MIRGLILSGGLRRPLLPLMINTPLPLLPVGNFPLVLYHLSRLKQAGITEIILSLAHQPRAIESLLGDGHDYGLTIRYMVESRPVGTGGAILRARDLIDDTLLVVNGDVLTDASISELLQHHRQRNALLTVTTCEVSDPGSYGVVESNRLGRITGFKEKPRGGAGSNEINAGVYALERRALDYLDSSDAPQSLEKDLIPRLIDEGAAIGRRRTRAYWSELTRPNRYLKTNLDLIAGRFSAPRFAAFDPPQKEVVNGSTRSRIDAGCILKEGARIEDSVIGAKCRIEESVQIQRSVLWPGCRIQRGAFVSGSILGRGVVVGEGARLRSGTLLGDKSNVADYSRL